MVKPARNYRVKVQGIEDYLSSAACRTACPIGTDTKGYARAIAEGDFLGAYLLARRTNPLVSICSRVCHAPCEEACQKRDAEGAVNIRGLKRFVCDRKGVLSPHELESALEPLFQSGHPNGYIRANDLLGLSRLAGAGRREGRSGERVAIIGSGPAGLAAAHDLSWLGYRVTIFESAPEPGGMLRWGIPEFRLSKELVQQEIKAILELGVEMKLNSHIGEEQALSDLRREGYRAVLIAVGLQVPRPLSLEGSDLTGVYNGITYLRQYGRITMGKTCVVIGGGGVAIDCAQMALRRGAGKVMVAALESWEDMPAREAEKADAREEGIRFYPSLGPKRILEKDGHVAGVEFLEVVSVFDDKGEFNPTYRPDSEMVLEADTVLLAVGQSAILSVLQGEEGLEITPGGTIRVDADLATGIPGIFAAGDILAGPQSVVDAIAHGQKAARSIHEHISGRKLRLKRKGVMHPLPPDFENTRSETISRIHPPKRSVKERCESYEEIDLSYEEGLAREQAARCQQCHIQTVFNRRLCILCGTCVDGCVKSALKMVRLENTEGDEKFNRLVATISQKRPSGRQMTAMIKDETRCVRCGVCARRCPAGAITMEAFHSEEEWEYE